MNYNWSLKETIFTKNKGTVFSGGSFPTDYNFNGNSINYIVGMSVPPIMMAKIALQIYEQWLSKL